ncbi:MAG: hypothetical protein K6F99_06055 [Lachnospiraceae bacterium]|nr:hypothetical protein [Lachnospiraceae bacterium]
MAEYLPDEVPEELLKRAKNLRESTEYLQSLDDSDLEGVTGGNGFTKTTGYAMGQKIECPVCGQNSFDSIDSFEFSEKKCSVFYCKNCEYTWGVDMRGRLWEELFK